MGEVIVRQEPRQGTAIRDRATHGKRFPEAEEPLREARDPFASMSYKPALAETGALLGESEAAAV